MRFDAERIRVALDEAEAQSPEGALLRRVESRLSASPRRRSPWPWIGMATACAVVLALGLFTWSREAPAPAVAAYIDGSESSIVGRWVKTGEETRQVHFSDGSKLALFANTEVKVESASPEQTRVRLGDGRTHVHVIHHQATDYRFQAGPFEIRVTGTKFDLAWQPSTNRLEVALLEGGVVVTGPGLSSPRKVGPGEVLRLNSETEEDHEADPTPPTDSVRGVVGKTESPDAPEQERSDAQSAAALDKTGSKTPTEVENLSWQTLLSSDERKRAVRVAEARGAGRVLGDGSTSSLLALAQAARLEGSPRFAEELLVGLRQTRGERGHTAFYLGKIAYDQLGKRAEAQKWFETYLREAPTGTFAEQAWTRLFELAGTSEQGKKWARDYLERYPSGASSARARSLLH